MPANSDHFGQGRGELKVQWNMLRCYGGHLILPEAELQQWAVGFVRAITSSKSLVCRKARMISERCRSFDKRANGYGRAEGVVAVAIKEAGTAGCAFAKILGICANNDGRSVTPITRPSTEQQQSCMRDVSEQVKQALAAVECHGTGTKAGDPVEVSSVTQVFWQSGSPSLPIGAIKANVNHTESAAGLVSLLKCCHVLACRGMFGHGGGFWQPESSIDVGPLSLSTEFQQIESRPVGVNCFGFSGTNVHAQLGPASEGSMAGEVMCRDQVLIISGKTEEAMSRQQEKLSSVLQNEKLSRRMCSNWQSKRHDKKCTSTARCCLSQNQRT